MFGLRPRSTGYPVLRTFPCSHAAPNAPADRWTFFGRLLPPSATAFPRLLKGRRLRHYYRSLLRLHSHCSLRACSTPFQRPSVSGLQEARSSRTAPSPDSYRGVSTIPRAGLTPAGKVHPHGAQETHFSIEESPPLRQRRRICRLWACPSQPFLNLCPLYF